MYRIGACALITNKDQDFLLVNLASFEEHFYAIPGGGLEEAETLEQAVLREVQEELGLTPPLVKVRGKASTPITFKFKNGPLVRNGVEYIGQERHYFHLQFDGEDRDINPNPEEIRQYVWSAYENLSKYLLFDHQLKDTQKMIKELVGI